MGGQY